MSISEAAKPQRACHASSKVPTKASMVTAATYMLLAGSTVQAEVAPANEGKSDIDLPKALCIFWMWL